MTDNTIKDTGTATRNTIPLLVRNPTTHKIACATIDYDGLIDAKTMRSVNRLFLKKVASGFFYPLDPMDAYAEVWRQLEQKAANLPALAIASPHTYLNRAANQLFLNWFARKVSPMRTMYREVEAITRKRAAHTTPFDIDNDNSAEENPDKALADICGDILEEADGETVSSLAENLRGGTPLHIRAQRALNLLSELCERILATDRTIGEKIVTAFAAYIVTDGHFVSCCKLTHISKDRWYREWPTWLAWARAAAREYIHI